MPKAKHSIPFSICGKLECHLKHLIKLYEKAWAVHGNSCTDKIAKFRKAHIDFNRGLVVTHLKIIFKDKKPFINFDSIYLHYKAAIKEHPFTKKLLNEYDPETQIVCLICFDDENETKGLMVNNFKVDYKSTIKSHLVMNPSTAIN